MKQQLIRAFEELAKNVATRREPGFQFKISSYRKAAKLFQEADNNVTTFANAEEILARGSKIPQLSRKK